MDGRGVGFVLYEARLLYLNRKLRKVTTEMIWVTFCASVVWMGSKMRPKYRDYLQCLGALVLCQLPIARPSSFLLTYAWCHCQSFQNTLVLIVTSAVVGCLPSCRMSRRNIDKHLRPSLFCFVSGSLLARWGIWRRTWVDQPTWEKIFQFWPFLRFDKF